LVTLRNFTCLARQKTVKNLYAYAVRGSVFVYMHPDLYRLIRSYAPLLKASAVMLALLVGWDATGLDPVLAQWFGDARGFALRDNFWTAQVFHKGARNAGWVLLIALVVGIWWPWGAFKSNTRGQRVQCVVSIFACLLLVLLFRRYSASSCPCDWAAFGGANTGGGAWVSHWNLWLTDGGPGKCFPSGHASAGFAFIAMFFTINKHNVTVARSYAAIVLIIGLFLGLVQQMRGAHFLSHTLWTGFTCWALCLAIDMAASWRTQRLPSLAGPSASSAL
jgi:membrane-associated PAP2 superfamily phosphatase